MFDRIFDQHLQSNRYNIVFPEVMINIYVYLKTAGKALFQQEDIWLDHLKL